MHQSLSAFNMNIVACLLHSAINFFMAGFSLIVVTWVIQTNSGNGYVSVLYLLISTVVIVSSVFGGYVADNFSRQALFLSMHLIRIVSASILLASALLSTYLTLTIFVFIVLRSIAQTMTLGLGDVIIREIVPQPMVKIFVVRRSFLQQICLTIGMGVGGWVAEFEKPAFAASVIFAVAIMQFPLVVFLLRLVKVESGRQCLPFHHQWREAGVYFAHEKGLLLAVSGIALTMAVAKLTNIMIPSFVAVTLGRGADFFGALEAVWTTGAVLILLLVSLRKVVGSRLYLEFLMLALLGCLMVALVLQKTEIHVFVIYGSMGALFALTNSLLNGYITSESSMVMIGRVRATTIIAANLMGGLVSLLTSVLSVAELQISYIFSGAALAIVGVSLFWLGITFSRTPTTQK